VNKSRFLNKAKSRLLRVGKTPTLAMTIPSRKVPVIPHPSLRAFARQNDKNPRRLPTDLFESVT
jgi:hypothetical protein